VLLNVVVLFIKKTGTGVLLTATELPDFLFLDESCSFFVRNVVYYCTPHAYSDILLQKVIPDSDEIILVLVYF